MRRFDIRPRRRLGQNFLVDENILGVIGDAADLDPGDNILEVGAGLGVLTTCLAERVANVVAIEFDEALRRPLEQALEQRENVTLVIGDAVQIDFSELAPAPGKLVANLPYNVAATCVIKAFYECPQLDLVCVMVQREVGDRLTASPGGKDYAATSVLVQAVAAQAEVRRLSRNIFQPVPNVDSSLITLRRSAKTPAQSFVDLVHDAFAHRRKPLANSIAHARRGEVGAKSSAREALERLGLPADIRAERLSAQQFLELDRLIGGRG